jgi:ABC-2 type transport system permease protein
MSPIHDQSYRHYEGTRLPPGRGWSVIAGTGVRAMLSRKAFLGLMLLAWVPFIVRAVQIYVLAMYPAAGQVEIIRVTSKTFESFLELQSLFVFFVTVWVGAGLIANDRRANALQIYLAKPIHRTEYILGKLTILFVYLLSITLLPALLLVLLQITFSGGIDLLRQHPALVPAIVLSSLLRVAVAAFTMLALSSLSKSSRYVAVLYAGAIFFTDAMFGVLRFITGSTRVAWVSITGCLDQVTDVIFREAPRYDTPVVVAFLVLAGLIVLSMSVLERRVRGVEVVQ